MANYLGHIDNGQNITIITTDKTLTVPKDHINFTDVSVALAGGEYDTAVELADVSAAVTEYFGSGAVFYEDGQLFYNGDVVQNALALRVVGMIEEGADPSALVNFMENLMNNPSSRAVNELYRFLECNDLPFTPDGHFLAYKSVGSDYRDRHTGCIDNSVGAHVEMPRNQVMDDPNQTCSSGLHFCSLHYLQTMFGAGGHIMILKINPADVVSIPVDYENSKGRCCAYDVIAEHHGGLQEDTLSKKSVWDFEDDEDDFWDIWDEDPEDDWI